MTQQRKIIHIDMDAFFASVEQRDNPDLRGKPVVVGGSPDKRGVVAAASYEARKYGIRSAMSSFQAAKRCPHLIFVKGRFDVYRQVSRQIREVFYDYTDLVEPLSLDEAYLDVTENRKNSPSATWIAQEIRQRIVEATQLTASAGVSYNKFLAKMASDVNKPDGICVIEPHQAEAFLDQLPIGKFYGIGKVTAAKMKGLGIHTGADLKTWPEDRLVAEFGKAGRFYWRIVRGEDGRPVCPVRVRKSVGAECTFERDLDDIADMRRELAPLIDDVLAGMKHLGRYGRTLTLKVKYHDFQQITRSRTVAERIKDRNVMIALSHELLASTEAGERPVRLLGVSISNLEDTADTAEPRQLTLI